MKYSNYKMKPNSGYLWALFLLLAAVISAPMSAQAPVVAPPVAKIIPKKLTTHGDTRVDNYYWLNERENPEVIKYLEAENAYTKSKLSHTEKFQEKLYDEIIGRFKQDDNSVPYLDNQYFYYTRYELGKEYPLYCRKYKNMDYPEEVMFDQNQLAAGHAFHDISDYSVSPDNNLVAFGEDTLSRRLYNIRIKNLKTNQFLPDVLPNTGGSPVWSADGQYIFYTTKDPSLREFKIFRHKLGDDAKNDQEIYHEKDETFSVAVGLTKSKKYIVIASYQTVSTEYRVLPANEPLSSFQVIAARRRNHEYSVDHAGDQFFIRTNKDGAKNFKLMTVSDKDYKEINWKDYIPHRSDALLEQFTVFKNHVVAVQRIEGISQVLVKTRDNSDADFYIDFGEKAYVAYLMDNHQYEVAKVRVAYQSLTTPPTVMDVDFKTKNKTIWKEQEVKGGFNKTDYVSERIFVTVRDGARVPVSIVYHKNTKKDGKAPLLLYAYGSYGYSMDPSFSSVRLSLLNRGFIYAIAHIRGGEEMGRQWYENGKLLKKKNTFTDFVDVGEYLVREKYAASDQLYAMGGSAGGLLMGAVINMRPDLWKGVIAAVPFVDVVTTMLDESIPLTTGEWDEWGNPKNKEYYDYMKSYSPYDNIAPVQYPNLLVTAGLHDSQVQYFEPAKWVAKMRATIKSNNLLLLHTNMEAGHGGASGRFSRHKETALEYAFLLDLAGIRE